ncbi:MAG: RnfABCDGE type electron transport complex subunit D [Candidatus Omnitrophica bacterium]|nr:RnfABCDGE type electron transport complex subunit D [Candidatus Omnitrophota bacterium]
MMNENNPNRLPSIHVAPSPHVGAAGLSTQRMMIDVLVALIPVIAASLYVFGWYAVHQIGICVLSCLIFEVLFTAIRGRRPSLEDCSAAVTGLILALSMPWSVPWYVGVVASGVAVGLGKVVFGGLGQNIFNPAMVGRAFVMISFPAAMGVAAYTRGGHALQILTQATPLTLAAEGHSVGLMSLFLGNVNGSLGETSALACLLGGTYLCVRRSASWEIPAGCLGAVAVFAGIGELLHPGGSFTFLHHLLAGSLLFGAFFIATDPVTSPLTPKGKWLFGAGVGTLVLILRVFSSYPEGVTFGVLLMNAGVPLINRWSIPTPLGGPVPPAK